MNRHDEEGKPVYSRKYDSNGWGQIAIAIDRYKLIWLLTITVSSWLGSRIISPLNEVSILAQQHLDLTARLVRDDKERIDMKTAINILTRLECLRISESERVVSGIRCTDIFLPTP